MNGLQLPAAGRGFWLLYGLLLLLAVGMGVRCGKTVAAVQAVRKQPVEDLTIAGPREDATVAKLVRLDSLIAAAQMSERDPFADPPVKRAPARVAAPRPPAPRAPEIPSLRALLFDNINPLVQISVGDSISGWMHNGDVFRGWTVSEITSSSVMVSKGIRNYVLSSH